MFEDIMHDGPIIESLIDLDTYKGTMGQLIFKKHPTTDVLSGFINRTKDINFTKFVRREELKEQMDHVRTLRCNPSEINYLRGIQVDKRTVFGDDYLEFLKRYQLPEYKLSYHQDNMSLRFPGEWQKQTYWETLCLSIATELLSRAQLKKMSKFQREALFAEGIKRLEKKIKRLKQFPNIRFIDFATRRRAFRKWHKYVVEAMASELPDQLIGTSNLKLGMELGLTPMGTNAHELAMVYSRLFGTKVIEIINSQHELWLDWTDLYGASLSIALPDTFGTDFFLRNFSYENALKSKGFRQDSGDPFEFVVKVLKFYQGYGIDPRTKTIIFSDALDVEMMIRISLYCEGKIQYVFGPGTNFGNDLGLFVASLVVKVLTVNGLGAVKLSDDLNKALGKPNDVRLFKRVAGYTNTLRREIVY